MRRKGGLHEKDGLCGWVGRTGGRVVAAKKKGVRE